MHNFFLYAQKKGLYKKKSSFWDMYLWPVFRNSEGSGQDFDPIWVISSCQPVHPPENNSLATKTRNIFSLSAHRKKVSHSIWCHRKIGSTEGSQPQKKYRKAFGQHRSCRFATAVLQPGIDFVSTRWPKHHGPSSRGCTPVQVVAHTLRHPTGPSDRHRQKICTTPIPLYAVPTHVCISLCLTAIQGKERKYTKVGLWVSRRFSEVR